MVAEPHRRLIRCVEARWRRTPHYTVGHRHGRASHTIWTALATPQPLSRMAGARSPAPHTRGPAAAAANTLSVTPSVGPPMQTMAQTHCQTPRPACTSAVLYVGYCATRKIRSAAAVYSTRRSLSTSSHPSINQSVHQASASAPNAARPRSPRARFPPLSHPQTAAFDGQLWRVAGGERV